MSSLRERGERGGEAGENGEGGGGVAAGEDGGVGVGWLERWGVAVESSATKTFSWGVLPDSTSPSEQHHYHHHPAQLPPLLPLAHRIYTHLYILRLLHSLPLAMPLPNGPVKSLYLLSKNVLLKLVDSKHPSRPVPSRAGRADSLHSYRRCRRPRLPAAPSNHHQNHLPHPTSTSPLSNPRKKGKEGKKKFFL